MANMDNASNKNLIIIFLRFMESDSRGTIALEQSSHHDAIKFFLSQQPFAMNLYKKFIETSLRQFPSIDNLSDTINTATRKFNSFGQQSHYFCMDMWLYIYH
jgi:hypothetical protein